MERAVQHIYSARAHLRRPREGRRFYAHTYRLYHMFAEYGLEHFGWMPFIQLGEPRDYVDADEFNQIHAPSRGHCDFNVRNTVGKAKQKLN